MYDAFVYFLKNHLDPYDAIAISVAIHRNAEVFISIDVTLKSRVAGLIDVKEPEEL